MAQHTTLEDAKSLDEELAAGLDLSGLDEALGTAPRRRAARKVTVEEEEDELSVTVVKA